MKKELCECGKCSPNFGMPGKSRKWCKECKPIGAIDVKHKKCECGKRSVFNLPGEKSGKWCISCKPIDAINVVDRKCKCGKQPCFNLPGKRSGLWCFGCKPKNAVDVNKRIKCLECDTRPSFNFEGMSEIYCSKHKKEGMVDVVSKKCKECNRCPSFNYEGMLAMYCSEHKKEYMVDVKASRCKENECNKRPSYNFNGMIAIYCSEHKKEGMILRKSPKKCKQCNIIQGNPKYDGHCLRCFIYLFPDKPITNNFKIKENHVFDEVIKYIPKDITIIRDKMVGGCSKRRPDLMIDMGSHWICAENDENCHKDYDTSCENKRIMELYTDMANRPMIIIRFNCDKYSDKQSLFKINKQTGIPLIRTQKEFKERTAKFAETINKYINSEPPEKAITIEYLYYD